MPTSVTLPELRLWVGTCCALTPYVGCHHMFCSVAAKQQIFGHCIVNSILDAHNSSPESYLQGCYASNHLALVIERERKSSILMDFPGPES